MKTQFGQVEFVNYLGQKIILDLELYNCREKYLECVDDDAAHIDKKLWNLDTVCKCAQCHRVLDEWNAQEGCQPFQLSDYTYEHCKEMFDGYLQDQSDFSSVQCYKCL